jgi:hypothetical protein
MPNNSDKEFCITALPGLAGDKDFNITSPIDYNYNCLAWAANRNNIIWWPHLNKFDGCDWPIENYSLEFDNLIEVYKKIGYQVCDDWAFEKKFKKIALYKDPDNQFTHAARQLRNGLWTSKLGPSFDITHGTPYTIEGDQYGVVGAFMSILF